MPYVMTMEGAPRGRGGKCKTVRNRRTGCTVKLCFTGRGRTGWQFQKGTVKCPR